MENRINDVLDRTGLNWKVRTEMVQTRSGILVPDSMAIVREDNNKVLAIHGKGYQPFQNSELIELLDKVSSKTGLDIHTGGEFRDGARVYIQLKSDDMKLNGDTIKGFITGINSFDGSTSLAFGPSNITISCMNKFFAAFRDIKTKVRHTKNMTIKIDDICRSLDLSLDEEKKVFNDIQLLSDIRVSDDNIDFVTRLLFNLDNNVDLKGKELSTVTKNKISEFEVDLNGELKSKGDSLWGLFSGVTKYTTHTIKRGGNDENKMVGVYGNRERRIFRELVND